MSSLHLLLLLYSTLRHSSENPCAEDRDRLVVSMGHISPAVYSVLCEYGYVDEESLCLEFRRAGSCFTGHVECCVPGIEWNTGNLGQGLSLATGTALGLKLKRNPAVVAALMGDGEQQKGQISEARRFAAKYELNNLFGIVDRNHLQICGDTDRVMPQKVRADYRAAGWNVLYVENGNHWEEVFQALKRVRLHEVDDPRLPSVIVARTTMGKGVSFMENKAKYHGSPLSDSEAAAAFEELGMNVDIELLRRKRSAHTTFQGYCCPAVDVPVVDSADALTYAPEVLTDNRSAYGKALEDLARLNNSGAVPRILAFSCDLEGSVKMDGFHKVSENAFFEVGIQEHHAASLSGAVSKEGFVPFFSTFGVFGVCETYNQHRLNDINHTQLKLVCTHLGLDVGEDGQTHQCIDYVGILQNLYGFSVFMPADPNQTDRIVRYVATHPGNYFVGMGRSKTPVITDEAGKPFFAGPYAFEPGKAEWVRSGSQAAILSYGAIFPEAMKAREKLVKEHGLSVALVNFASIKPLDEEAVLAAAGTGLVVTAEDHHVDTGLGARVATVMADKGAACRLLRLGVKRYGLSGQPADLFDMEGISARGIVDAVLLKLLGAVGSRERCRLSCNAEGARKEAPSRNVNVSCPAVSR